MYILAGLQPGEDATGGAWFTDGVLDHELMEALSIQLERKISEMSWKQVTDVSDSSAGSGLGVSRKRKEPADGFDAATKGKEKMRRNDTDYTADAVPGSSGAEGDDHYEPPSEKQDTDAMRPKRMYDPHPAGYQKYPTLKDLTNFINENDFVPSGKIPENNISQLLDVMAYDDRIIKIKSPADGSAPTMYKARKSPTQLKAEVAIDDRIRNTKLDETKRMKAFRELEVQRLGSGGITEIPCGRCPVFDMCEVGGPVSPNNCEYFEDWFLKLESARRDKEAGLTW